MFCGIRCCVRTKPNHKSLTRTNLSHQPLLFLYPRWFPTQQQRNFTKPSCHDLSERTEGSSKSTTLGSCTKVNSDIVEPFLSQHVHQQPSQDPSKAPAHGYTSSQFQTDTAAEQKLEAILSKRKARQDLVVQERRLDGRRHGAYFPAPGSTSSAVQRDRKQRINRSTSSERSRWEHALNLLASSVPQHKEAEGEEIWLSKQALIALSGTSAANSWVHHARGGCEVEVTERQSSTRMSRQLFLRGSTRAVALTREHFVMLEKDAQLHPGKQAPSISKEMPSGIAPGTDSSDCRAVPEPKSGHLIRLVRTARQRHLGPGKWMRADELPEPATYDVRSFKEYVEDLITARAPRLVRRELYGNQNETHNMVVASVLRRLFTDTNTASFASTVALNLALAFLCEHTELSGESNLFYQQCRRLRLKWQPRTYSYLLCAAVVQDDMTKFRKVLDDLLSDGHRPDSKLWLALLKRASSLQQKRTAIDWMLRKDLWKVASVKGHVAAEIFSAELKSKKHDQRGAGQVLAPVGPRRGNDWMSKSYITQALHACAYYRASDLAAHICKEAQNRDVILDRAVTSIVLLVMQRRGSLRDSVDFFTSNFVRIAGRNDHCLIPILFMTAWKSHFYNVCRVLWRYAASQGAITYKMQSVVTQSLRWKPVISTASVVKEGLTGPTVEWRQRAGKVIVGMDLDTRGFQRFFHLFDGTSSRKSANPMVWLAQDASDDEMQDQQSALAYVMIYRDLDAWKHFGTPSRERLFNLLSEAYAIDVRWKSQGIGLNRGGKSTEWMIENAIDVPLVKREISLGKRYLHRIIENG